MPIRALLAVPLTLLAATPALAQSWEAEALALHNRERASWRVPPMSWDLGLAGSADLWAQELARTGQWGHSPKSWRPRQGENLWMGTTGAYRIDVMVGSWLDERRMFRAGIFPAVSSTGNWSDVGHYTQMVGSRTTQVGCAMRSGGGWTYLVCRYSPSANVDGRAVP